MDASADYACIVSALCLHRPHSWQCRGQLRFTLLIDGDMNPLANTMEHHKHPLTLTLVIVVLLNCRTLIDNRCRMLVGRAWRTPSSGIELPRWEGGMVEGV